MVINDRIELLAYRILDADLEAKGIPNQWRTTSQVCVTRMIWWDNNERTRQ